MVARKWINGLRFAIYLLYKLNHESNEYFENEKYLNLNLKKKKNWWTKLYNLAPFWKCNLQIGDTRLASICVIPKFLKIKQHVNVTSTSCVSWAVFVLISMKLKSSTKSLLYGSHKTQMRLLQLFIGCTSKSNALQRASNGQNCRP